MPISTIILAAGHGRRMKSKKPKVLHKLAGRPILEHILRTAQQLPNNDIYIVYGFAGDDVRTSFQGFDVQWVLQEEQLGTGHAVLQVLPQLKEDSRVLILVGDIPLISEKVLNKLYQETPEDSIGIISVEVPDPTGLGRIVRDPQGQVIKIVEHKDANDVEQTIKEINTGIMLVPCQLLKDWVPNLKNQNNQKEYYLTDIFEFAAEQAIPIKTVKPLSYYEVQGINDRAQLARLERHYQLQNAKSLMQEGVTLLDPNRLDIRGDVTVGQDTVIDVNVILEGDVAIGKNCRIGPNCLLRDVIIKDNVTILANTVIEETRIENDCQVGPFSRVRPGTELGEDVHIGNFVELKKSSIGSQTKIGHLSYVGDATIGKSVNIGAGTITCNYDGANKHKTVIGDYAFIGSDTQFIAPVSIGKYATIGAGSTICKDAPEYSLTLSRVKQTSIEGWQRPVKKTSDEEGT